MRRDSWLDRMVYSFQHRWETNPQYRAAVSGVVGLALLVAMCSCSGIVSAMANTTLASMGIGASGASQGNGSPNTGTSRIAGAKEFAIPTQVWTPGVVPPASPIANSLTPAPTATPVPTATDTPTPGPCTANCGGGGVGGGYSVHVTGSIVPSSLTGLQQATIHIHTTVPNVGVGFLLTTDTNGTYTGEDPSYTTDGNGDFQLQFQVPSCTSYAKINLFAQGAAPSGVPGYAWTATCK